MPPGVTPVYQACRSAGLSARAHTATLAPGQERLTIVLTSTSPIGCRLEGFPAVRVLSDRKTVTATIAIERGEPQPLRLEPGVSAAFTLTYTVRKARAPALWGLAVIPPGDVRPLYVPAAIDAGERMLESPLRRI